MDGMGKTALYVLVSTAEQNLDRQRSELSEYATDRLEVPLREIEIHEDKGTGRTLNARAFSGSWTTFEPGRSIE